MRVSVFRDLTDDIHKSLKTVFRFILGASSGLGLLQIPPLDLKQVEVIKGSTSTLYGGGAIAGLVNLISKTPTDERDLRFHINGTSGRGLDINGFMGKNSIKLEQLFSLRTTETELMTLQNWFFRHSKV